MALHFCTTGCWKSQADEVCRHLRIAQSSRRKHQRMEAEERWRRTYLKVIAKIKANTDSCSIKREAN